MKKLVLLGAFLTLFTSCSNDDNINVTITEPTKEAHMEIQVTNTGDLENFQEHDVLSVYGKNSLRLFSSGKPLDLHLDSSITRMYKRTGIAVGRTSYFTEGKVDQVIILKGITPIQKNIGTELKTNIKVYANGELKREYNQTFSDDAPSQFIPQR